MIVEKAVKMAEMMNVPVLGIVENMSYFECPDCKKKHAVFGESHIEDIAAKYGLKHCKASHYRGNCLCLRQGNCGAFRRSMAERNGRRRGKSAVGGRPIKKILKKQHKKPLAVKTIIV